MKKFFIATLACAALASCYNNDTTIATNLEPIYFGDNFVENAVRVAYDPSYGTKNTLTSIIVYGAVEGVNIFPGVTVEGTVGTTEVEGVAQPNVWVQKDGTVQYWIAGANYTFDAVAGVEKSAVTTDTASGTGLPTSIHYEVAKQTDMLHQRVTTTGKPDTNNGLVAFTFTHLLSKVKLTVENTTAAEATGYQYTISDIQLTNVRTKGDYAVSDDGTWAWGNFTTGSYSISNIVVASGKTEECATEVLLIPGANIGISLKVNTQMKKGEEWVTITTSDLKVYNNVKTLVANSAYNFKVSLGLDDQIKFTVTENPTWDNGNTHDSNDGDTVNDYIPLS
jgi:hypothetical protein